MIAITDSFSYIQRDSKGKPYTIKVNFTTLPVDGISVTVQEIDEESGFQEIYNYSIREVNNEFVIGIMKNQQLNPIKSQLLDELKEQVLARYWEVVRKNNER